MVRGVLVLVALVLAGCGPSYDPVAFHREDDRIVANGTIDATTLPAFLKITMEHPDVTLLELRNIAGSIDDDANLVFSRYVRRAGFDTLVPSGGMVASGGTDLFLAGNERILEEGACVGVHSWGADGGVVAAELPRDAADHLPYLAYFEELGADPDFYWFTLEAAPAEDMHWMSANETRRFAMTTEPVAALTVGDVCFTR